jgi:SHS2 domain-containing protein
MSKNVVASQGTDSCSKGFEEISHTADAALRVWGQDLKELFLNAARGLAWLMVDPQTVPPAVEVPLDLSAPDAETLLVTWLGELIYLYEREGAVFTEFDLEEVTPTHLRGTVRGGPQGLETVVVFDV